MVKRSYQEYHLQPVFLYGEPLQSASYPNYPGGIGSVSIRGGEFSSTHANAIRLPQQQ